MKSKGSIARDTSSLRLGVPGCLYVGQPPSEWLRVNQAGRTLQFDAGSTSILILSGGLGPTDLEDLTGMWEWRGETEIT